MGSSRWGALERPPPGPHARTRHEDCTRVNGFRNMVDAILQCPACGATNFDPGRFFRLYGLCLYCFEEKDERIAAQQRLRTLVPALPMPPFPCVHVPGSTGKAEAMAWRLSNGYSLHHPSDGITDPNIPVADTPLEVIDPSEIIPGVEMDRGKGRLAWRARPRWRDVRVRLGRFHKYTQAAEAVRSFYIERWGRYDESRPWLHQPAALAVVRTQRGWCDLDYPSGIARFIARSAAAAVAAKPYPAPFAVRSAFRRELGILTQGAA